MKRIIGIKYLTINIFLQKKSNEVLFLKIKVIKNYLSLYVQLYIQN